MTIAVCAFCGEPFQRTTKQRTCSTLCREADKAERMADPEVRAREAAYQREYGRKRRS